MTTREPALEYPRKQHDVDDDDRERERDDL